jgi:hypothetical protein
MLHIDVNMVDSVELDIEAFKKWRNGEYANVSKKMISILRIELKDGKRYSMLLTR